MNIIKTLSSKSAVRQSHSCVEDGQIRPQSKWDGLRGWMDELLQHRNFDVSMCAVIVLNMGFMIYETDQGAECLSKKLDCNDNLVIPLVNFVFLAIYTGEFAMRVYVDRFKVFCDASTQYERVDGWNILDAVVVLFGYVDMAIWYIGDDFPTPSLSILRILRVFRLLRAIRIVRKIPELKAMLRGFVSAMKSMFWGFFMIIVLLLIFSVLSVELVHPISLRVHEENEYCKQAFENVWYCMLLLFQTLVSGDSWGNCTIPVIKESWWAFGIFATALLCVQLGFMNLILAVIVENANRARLEDEEELALEKKKASDRLKRMLESIDTDGSKKISLQELMDGYESNSSMRGYFSQLGVSQRDLERLFDLIYEDDDNEDELSYEIMMESLRDINTSDQRKNISFLRLQSEEIVRLVKKLCDRHRPVNASLSRGLSRNLSRNCMGTAPTKTSMEFTSDSKNHVNVNPALSYESRLSKKSHGSDQAVRSHGPVDLPIRSSKIIEPLEKQIAQLRREMKGLADSLMKQLQDPDNPKRGASDSLSIAPSHSGEEMCHLKSSQQPVANFRSHRFNSDLEPECSIDKISSGNSRQVSPGSSRRPTSSSDSRLIDM